MRSIKVFANGFPKTGNHGLVKACELLGLPAIVNHVPHRNGLPEDATHSIHIRRDPRNVLVSMLRFNGQPVTPGTFIARFRRFQEESLIEEMAAFEPWLTDRKTLTVAFEDLIADDRSMKRIAEYVGVRYEPGSWERLPGRTFTWNDEHSDYRQVWTRSVQSVWEDEGGNQLMARWGYGKEIASVGTFGISEGI